MFGLPTAREQLSRFGVYGASIYLSALVEAEEKLCVIEP